MATLKVKQITDRVNGYGMPVVEIESDANITVINRGYNEFEAITEIDETDLLTLRGKFSGHDRIHLEITTPERKTCAYYKLSEYYLGGDKRHLTCIIW